MATIASAQQPTERVAWNKLWWVGLLTILAVTLVNVLIQQIAAVVLRPDPGFGPLMLVPPILFSVVGIIGAVIVFAIIGRFAQRPITLFRRVALVVMLVSLIPDIGLLLAPSMPGTTVGTVGALVLMHIVSWAIAVSMLTRLARA